MHVDRHPQQLPGEFERRRVVRDRAGTVAADVEAGPGDEIVEGKLGLDRACRLAVDQERIGRHACAGAPGRRLLAHETLDMHAEPVRTWWHLAVRSHDLMAARSRDQSWWLPVRYMYPMDTLAGTGPAQGISPGRKCML